MRYYSQAMVAGEDVVALQPERPWKSTSCKTAYVCFLMGSVFVMLFALECPLSTSLGLGFSSTCIILFGKRSLLNR